ncbi:hypothetical protein L208DRAFT_1124840, partial [Tricholoma matsutake]
MTDYSSQGKTHEENVVELGHSESHQVYYTALSRSSTAAGTLLLTGFHPHKIQGGGSGALRQEFHELELLDTITKLQWEEQLTKEMALPNQCNTLIALFQKVKGPNFMPPAMHKALQWSTRDPYLEGPHIPIN